MRLIDADKISPQWKTTATGTDTEAHKTYTYWHRVIDEAPTVEAIPIEWIKRWLGGSRTSGLSIDVYTMLHDWEVMEGRK